MDGNVYAQRLIVKSNSVTTTSDLSFTDNAHIETSSSMTFSVDRDDNATGSYFGFGTNSAARDGNFDELVRITEDGNVGIGVTNPGNRLAVLKPSGSSSTGEIAMGDGTQWQFMNSNQSSGAWNPLVQSGDHTIIYSNGSQNTGNFFIGPWSSSSNGLKLLANGNVGIGTHTPAERLEVDGNVYTQRLLIKSNSVSSTSDISMTANAHIETDNSMSFSIDSDNNETGAYFAFGRNSAARDGSFNEMMRITESGNVGLGTTSPSATLHIGPENDDHIYLASSNNSYGWVMDTRDNGGGSVPFRIYKRTNNSDTEVLTILNQNGNVGVGDTNPAEKLEVNGHIRASGMLTGTPDATYGNGGRMRDRSNDNGFSVDWTGGVLRFYIESTNVKNFIIDHPDNKDKYLVHTTLEGPENGVYYRGTAKLKGGETTVELPDYFNSLTQDGSATVILTPKGKKPFLLSYDDFEANQFNVYAECEDCEFDWEVKAKRQDVPELFVEPDKDEIVVSGNGPYKHYGIIRKTGDAAASQK